MLTELIDEHVDPLVRRLVRFKFQVSLQPSDDRQVNQDGLDLASEIKTQIVARLSSLKAGNGAGPIGNLEAYVRTVAANAFSHKLRKKYPNRLRLKNQLRYVLTHDRRVSLWESADSEWLCGRREQHATGAPIDAFVVNDVTIDQIRTKLEAAGLSPERSELVDLVVFVLEHIGTALGFDDFLRIVYNLKRISEPIEVTEDEAANFMSPTLGGGLPERMEQTAFLSALWEEICRLPLRHRTALLLNLKNTHGEGLITLLPLTGVATIRQIAEALEFPPEDFAAVWNTLPWDDRAIADHLGLTRQQVINLRQSARATLRRRLNYG